MMGSAVDGDHPRHEPTPATIKTLFALSGNRCAYPACTHSIITTTGEVVAQVAHIKGVKPKSARFDASVKPIELREAGNLLILCYEHHVVTNNEEKYSVEAMRKMKAAHEARFGGVLSGLRASVSDLTTGSTVRIPLTLTAYAAVNELDLNDAHVSEFRSALNAFTDMMTRLTPDIRTVYSCIIDRGTEEAEGNFEVTVTELEQVLGLSASQLGNLLAVLQRYGLVDVYFDEGREGYHQSVAWAATMSRTGRWPEVFLTDVRHVARALEVPIATLIVDLDWSTFGG